MKISIITVCRNSVKTIEDTIKSVLSQSYKDIEYIIVDGGSDDGTLEIIHQYRDKIDKVVSEPDNGIYDAMNKGIQLATGNIIGILNSDDLYNDKNVLKKVTEVFNDTSVDACYGNIEYVKRNNINKLVRHWRAGTYHQKKMRSGWTVPHPTFFVKKELYDKYGKYKSNYKIAADFELILRFINKGIKVYYLDQTLVRMRERGISASSFKQRLIGWNELKIAWLDNDLSVPLFFIVRRVLSKIKQYFV